MPKKKDPDRHKPPIDRDESRSRLDRAQRDQTLVLLRRWLPKADPIEGFVVATGRRWVAVQQLDDRIRFDGWRIVRRKDIQAVSIQPDPDCFEIAALRARHLWPPTSPTPELDLDDTLTLLRTASEGPSLVSIFDESARPDVCRIGTVLTVEPGRLRLLEVDPRAVWSPKARSIDPADVTRVDIGGGYEEALALVAGPAPTT